MHLKNGTIDEFINDIGQKQLVCVGAGQALINFLSRYSQAKLHKRVKCIADNDETKEGQDLTVLDSSIPIVSVKKMLGMDNIVVMISCTQYADIYNQLNSYEELKDTLCYIYSFIIGETNEYEEENRVYPTNLRISDRMLIPKKIHYCWFGKNEIPLQNIKWMESWKKYCPDYEIIRWDESNYDITKNQYMFESYKAGRWGFVPDYARLDIVYNCGGIYLDTDVEIIRNLDDLLYQKAFSGVDGTKNISLGLGFGAEPQHKMVKELKNLYNDMRFINKDGTQNLTACPTLQKGLFNKMGYLNNGEYQVINNMAIYPEKVLSGKCNYTGRILPNQYTFAIHHYDGSWVTEERKRKQQRNQEVMKLLGYM